MFKNNIIIKKLSAGFMAGLCAFSMLGSTLNGTIPANAASVSTTENAAFPSADKVIAQAATLLGTPYNFGFKGFTGVYYQDSYKALDLDFVRNQGLDCSGLVYYTLTHLGYKTSGFSWNNPVPVDTTHWLTVNDNCTISYGGVTSKIDVEKKKISTEERPYWECADGSTITPGSVVVAEMPDSIDHAWIYMGEFNSRADVVTYLKNIGVDESLITSATVGSGSGDGGRHWRIESNASQGVVINNNTDGKKASVMNMYAYRITQTDVTFANDIFHDDLQSIYQEQTLSRDELKSISQEQVHQMVMQIQNSAFNNLQLEKLVKKLHEQLQTVSGKKVYGYLPQDVKRTVDDILAELAKDKQISQLYEKWCELERLKHKIYTQKEPELPPLTDNKVFKPVKNMIIRTVLETQTEPILADQGKAFVSYRLAKSAEDGNEQAEQLLENMEQRETSAFASTIFGLLVSLSRMIEDDYNRSHKKLQSKVDSKIQHMIRKHKQELGIRDEHDMTMA